MLRRHAEAAAAAVGCSALPPSHSHPRHHLCLSVRAPVCAASAIRSALCWARLPPSSISTFLLTLPRSMQPTIPCTTTISMRNITKRPGKRTDEGEGGQPEAGPLHSALPSLSFARLASSCDRTCTYDSLLTYSFPDTHSNKSHCSMVHQRMKREKRKPNEGNNKNKKKLFSYFCVTGESNSDQLVGNEPY